MKKKRKKKKKKKCEFLALSTHSYWSQQCIETCGGGVHMRWRCALKAPLHARFNMPTDQKHLFL